MVTEIQPLGPLYAPDGYIRSKQHQGRQERRDKEYAEILRNLISLNIENLYSVALFTPLTWPHGVVHNSPYPKMLMGNFGTKFRGNKRS